MTAKTELISMQHFIGGEWTDAENAAVFDDFNPLDDSLYGRAAKGTRADMESAIAAARRLPRTRPPSPTNGNAGYCVLPS